MRTINTLKHFCAWVACLGVLSPAATFGATPDVLQSRSASLIKDVELSANGTLDGQIVDQQGNQVSGAAVTLLQGNQQVAQTRTDTSGSFSVPGLRGGTYQIASVHGVNVYRAWAVETAPPTAADSVLLVSQQSVVRGQCPGGCGTQPAYGQPVYGQPMYGQPVQGEVIQAPMAQQGQMVQGGEVVGGQVAQGEPVYGPWVQGQPVAVGEPMPCGGGCGPAGCGGGGYGFLANPWIIGGAVAAAIAIPLALDDDDDDHPPSS